MGIRSVAKKVVGYFLIAISLLVIVALIFGIIVAVNLDGSTILMFLFLINVFVATLLLGIWWVRPSLIKKMGIASAYEGDKGEQKIYKKISEGRDKSVEKLAKETGLSVSEVTRLKIKVFGKCKLCGSTESTKEYNRGGNPVAIGIMFFVFLPIALVMLSWWNHYVCKKCGVKI